MKYAVRCCCRPEKVLGHLNGPAGVPGFYVTFRESFSNRHQEAHYVRPEAPVYVEVRAFRHEDGSRELAVYSDDRPIEFWAQIPSFVPLTS